jgi:hypothetical protein
LLACCFLAAGHTIHQSPLSSSLRTARKPDRQFQRRRWFRLLDCWAPELKLDPRLPESKREAEKRRGLAAKANLIHLAEGKDVTVQIPLSPDGDVSKVWTMGRVLGRVWLVSDPAESLSERQVREGFATEKREELK